MPNSLTIKHLAVAGAAAIGMLVIASQQAVAGGRFGGFHGGGAPHPAIHVGGFRAPVHVGGFRPVVRPVFRPAVRIAAPRIHGGGVPAFGHPIRGAGLAHGGWHGLGHERQERTRFGRLERDGGRHVRLPLGVIAPVDDQPAEAAPAIAVEDEAVPVVAAGFGKDAGSLPADRTAGGAMPTADARAATCAAAGSFVAVQFAPKATAADLSNFLNAYNVTIADGPTRSGSYRLRLSDRPLPSEQVRQVIRSMQSQSAIVSVVAQS